MRGGRRVAATAAVAGLALALLAGAGLWYHRVSAPAAPALAALASVGELLQDSGAAADWRLARLRSNPQILVIEFPGLHEQALALNRLAALTEKASAPRDRLLPDDELAALIQASGDTPDTYYFGHDYRGSALVRFFTLAASQPALLNAQEQRLRGLLLAQQVLAAEGQRLVGRAPPRAVISFTRPQADDPATPADETVDAQRREAVLRHELSHGQFFTRAEYREHCWEFWRNALSEGERERFRGYLSGIDYDPRNEELMVNETQALLMHTPDPRAFDAADVGLTPERLRSLQIRFGVGVPAGVLPDPAAGTP
ncbi:MAG TPA: hypothetical protein VLA16_10465 [Ideonella sp.]|nr:hypothetical protein [Ideonella sp.]